MAVYAITWAKSGVPSSGPLVMSYPEAATMTFKKGDPVKLTTGGLVEDATDEDESIFGIALEDASGTTSDPVAVLVINPWSDIFSASISAAGATADSAQTDIGLAVSFIKSTQTGETNKMVLDRTNVTTPSCEIIGAKDPIGTTDGRLYFRWIPIDAMHVAAR
jgi:hypothetical protein